MCSHERSLTGSTYDFYCRDALPTYARDTEDLLSFLSVRMKSDGTVNGDFYPTWTGILPSIFENGVIGVTFTAAGGGEGDANDAVLKDRRQDAGPRGVEVAIDGAVRLHAHGEEGEEILGVARVRGQRIAAVEIVRRAGERALVAAQRLHLRKMCGAVGGSSGRWQRLWL